MGFSRAIQPVVVDNLTAGLVGIGMNFSAKGDFDANIEDHLLFASEAGMEGDDLRVLSVLTTWLGAHAAYVNVMRLAKLVKAHPSTRVRAYWAAWAAAQDDRRFHKMANWDNDAVTLLRKGSAFQVRRRGQDARFDDERLVVPAGTLRQRASDVLTPEALAQRHLGYRHRVMMGPSWRADVWTVLTRNPELTTAEAARQAHCAFATAWQVARDFNVLSVS